MKRRPPLSSLKAPVHLPVDGSTSCSRTRQVLEGSAEGDEPEKACVAPHREATTKTCRVLMQDVGPSTVRWTGASRKGVGVAFSSSGRVRHVSTFFRRLGPSRFDGVGSAAILSEVLFLPKQNSLQLLLSFTAAASRPFFDSEMAPSSPLTGIIMVNVEPDVKLRGYLRLKDKVVKVLGRLLGGTEAFTTTTLSLPPTQRSACASRAFITATPLDN